MCKHEPPWQATIDSLCSSTLTCALLGARYGRCPTHRLTHTLACALACVPQLEVSLGINEEYGKRLDQELKESAKLSSLLEEAKLIIADLQVECEVRRTEVDGAIELYYKQRELTAAVERAHSEVTSIFDLSPLY